MSSRAKIAKQLAAAARSKALVRIERTPRNADQLDGFVVGIGSKWVLISRTGDGGYLDEGFVAIRRKEISTLREDTSFEEQFARSQAGWPPSAPAELDLDTTSGLVRGMSQVSPMIGIEQEHRFHSEMVWIGVVGQVDKGWLWLREVGPDAAWRDEAVGYKLRRITKVTISDRYQTALASIAGALPPHSA